MTDWRVTVTLKGEMSDDDAVEIGRLIEADVCTVERRPAWGQADVSFVISETDQPMEVAVHDGLDRVENVIEETGLSLQMIGVQIEEFAEWLRRLDEPDVREDLVGAVEAAEILNISRTRVHQLAEKNPDFPKPRHELTAGKLWARQDIEEFDRRWERRKGRPRKEN
jgi:hypothetical protein